MNMGKRVLAIGAHFDDVELGCSGTLLRHRAKGDDVTILVVTDSEYHNGVGECVRDRSTARTEGQRAADLIGARLVCMEEETFSVHFDESLTRKIMDVVEEMDVDVIYAPWVHDLHRDHQFTGRCALMAGRHVPRYLMYRPNYYDTEAVFRGNFYVDISPWIEQKKQVIMAHRSELERVRYQWLDFFMNQNANEGLKIGVPFAECFEVVRYLQKTGVSR